MRRIGGWPSRQYEAEHHKQHSGPEASESVLETGRNGCDSYIGFSAVDIAICEVVDSVCCRIKHGFGGGHDGGGRVCDAGIRQAYGRKRQVLLTWSSLRHERVESTVICARH